MLRKIVRFLRREKQTPLKACLNSASSTDFENPHILTPEQIEKLPRLLGELQLLAFKIELKYAGPNGEIGD